MTTLVVYESMWGATRDVAAAVGDGLAAAGAEVTVVEVSQAAVDVPDGVDLLVVGGPTHAFGMTRAQTRADAAREHAPVISGTGVREWLERITLPDGVRVAAFDTKVARPNLPGSACSGIDKALRRRGGRRAADPETFRVHGKWDGLVTGELDRARAWGAGLVGGA